MKHYLFNRKIRQLSNLAEMSHVFFRSAAKRALGIFTIVIGILIVNQVGAQISFAPGITNPFGLPVTDYVQGAKFTDWDGDGDQDLIISEIWGTSCPFHYYENIGTPTELELADPIVNPFGLVSTPGYSFQTTADLDDDGDYDLLVGINSGNYFYFENTGSATEPQFPSHVTNPFGLTSTDLTAIVEFVDLDGDGDFDLMVGEDDGVLQYFENIGSATVPNFASPLANPFGYHPSPTGHSNGTSFADLDYDGDLDMLVCVGGITRTEYFENIGTAFDPQFSDPLINPFGFNPTNIWVVPDFADLDGDGDKDVFFGYQSESQYYENTTIMFSSPITNPFGLPVTDYLQGLAFADLDGDGDQDLLTADIAFENVVSGFHYFENIGTPTELQFASPVDNPFGLVAYNILVFPALEDIDGDLDYDLMVGLQNGNFRYFENTGSPTEPQFASPVYNPFGLQSTNTAIPRFVDLDDDGDFDLMVGENGGIMEYFENTGSVTAPFYTSPQANPFGLEPSPTDISNACSFADLDYDGDLDMLMGKILGTEYFENIGTASNPLFAPPELDPFGIDPTIEYGFPEYADLDDDGDKDLLIAFYSLGGSGQTQYYENFSPLSVFVIPQSLAIGLYPNPVMDILYFKAEEQIDRIEIFSITGQLTKTFENPGNMILINDLNPGLYVLRIISVKGDYTVRKIQKL